MQGLYRIVCTVTGTTYVGSSVHVATRLRQHVNGLNRGTHENPKLQRAWNKYGESAFVFQPYVSALSKHYLVELEQQALDELLAQGGCFNICKSVVSPRLGLPNSPEARAKISAARKGMKLDPIGLASRRLACQGLPNPMQGRKHSAATKALISERLKQGFREGRPPTIAPPTKAFTDAQAIRLRETPLRKDKGKPLCGTKDGEYRKWLTTIACAKDLGCDVSYPSQRVNTEKLVKGWSLRYL